LVVPAIAFAVSLSQPKKYSASASLLFRDPGFDQKLFGSSVLPASTDPTREAETNLRLVSLEVVAHRAAARLRKTSADDLANKISVAAEGQSNVVKLTVTDRSPVQAAREATSLRRNTSTFGAKPIARRLPRPKNCCSAN